VTGAVPAVPGTDAADGAGHGPVRRRAARRPAARLRRPGGVDLGVCLLFLLLAGWVTAGLWADPSRRVLALNAPDQTLYEWFLAYDTRLFSGDFGLVSDRLNAPDGVNLLANTSVIALGALFTPVTLLFGVPVTFTAITTLNLAGTAVAWYLLFTRTLRAHRLAAAVGGGFCGFAPGMVSQANSHLHMTAQWLVPLLVWLVVRLVRAADPHDGGGRDPRRVVTSGLALAAVVTIQVFIGEEVLFLTAVTLAVMTVGYAAARPAFARRVLPGFLAGMLVAVATAAAALAYPLWMQFAGPQSVPDGAFLTSYFSADLASFPAVSPLSALGSDAAARLGTGAAEYDTFLGWPMLVVAVACLAWLRRSPLVVACALAAVVTTALSLGPRVVVDGGPTAVPGPFALLEDLPVVASALPVRFALPLVPLIATLLVLAVDRAVGSPVRWVRALVPAAVFVALLPAVPAALPTEHRAPAPVFFAEGHWRRCVPPGGVLVPVPLPTPKEPWTMRWPAAAEAAFGVPEGFFIGPYGRNGTASMGIYPRPTSRLLAEIGRTGRVPVIGPEQRAGARRDVAYWKASCVVLVPTTAHTRPLLLALEALFGPATVVADAYTWQVG
jgi:hypothetical protein